MSLGAEDLPNRALERVATDSSKKSLVIFFKKKVWRDLEQQKMFGDLS